MKNAVIYVHGKDGSANEANHYKQFFNEDYEVIGFDYKSKFPWQAKEEFQKYFDFVITKYNEILLIGNSIGAYFSMISLSEKQNKKSNVYITHCGYGKCNFKYDEMGKCI